MSGSASLKRHKVSSNNLRRNEYEPIRVFVSQHHTGRAGIRAIARRNAEKHAEMDELDERAGRKGPYEGSRESTGAGRESRKGKTEEHHRRPVHREQGHCRRVYTDRSEGSG